MSGKQKTWIIVCGMLVAVLGAAAYWGNAFFSRPINPSLQLNTAKAPPAEALPNPHLQISPNIQALKAPPAELPEAATQKSVQPPQKALLAQAPPAADGLQQQPEAAMPLSEQEGMTHCGYSGTTIILFLGTDERDEIPYGADAIRFIKVDFSNQEVTCINLSRDLWVKTPVLNDEKVKELRLGEVFDYVQMRTRGTLQEQYLAATTAVAQTIFDNFGIAPDRYITVPQSAFAMLVDELGGIELDVPQDQDAYKHVVLKGRQTLNGQQCLAYIRLFEGNILGDFQRNSRQLPFVKAVLAKMAQPANIMKIPGILSKMQEKIVTDLSAVRIASLLCMLQQVMPQQVASADPLAAPGLQKVSYHSLKPDMASQGPQDALLPDTPKIQGWLQDLLKK